MKYGQKLILALALISSLMMAFSAMGKDIVGCEPSVTGPGIYIVLSGSMSPAIETGDIVVIRSVSADDIKVGDVITFWAGMQRRAAATHRVVSVAKGEELAFITKGDANEREDVNPVPLGQVIGKVVYKLPYIGYFLGFVRRYKEMVALVALILALLILPEFLGPQRVIPGGKSMR